MSTAEQLSPPVAQWLVQALTRLVSTFAIVQGAFIILDGAARWTAPAWKVAMRVPGAPETWGSALFILGVLGLLGTFVARHRLTSLAMWGIGTWSLFFAISLGAAAFNDPKVSTVGFFTYVTMAITSCTLSVGYHQSHPYQRSLRALR